MGQCPSIVCKLCNGHHVKRFCPKNPKNAKEVNLIDTMICRECPSTDKTSDTPVKTTKEELHCVENDEDSDYEAGIWDTSYPRQD